MAGIGLWVFGSWTFENFHIKRSKNICPECDMPLLFLTFFYFPFSASSKSPTSHSPPALLLQPCPLWCLSTTLQEEWCSWKHQMFFLSVQGLQRASPGLGLLAPLWPCPLSLNPSSAPPQSCVSEEKHQRCAKVHRDLPRAFASCPAGLPKHRLLEQFTSTHAPLFQSYQHGPDP